MEDNLKRIARLNASRVGNSTDKLPTAAEVVGHDRRTCTPIVKAAGARMVLPSLSNGAIAQGQVVPIKGGAIDVQHHLPRKTDAPGLPPLKPNSLKRFVRYLMGETADLSDPLATTKVILGGLPSGPVTLTTLPSWLRQCEGDPSDPSPGAAGAVCRTIPNEREYVIRLVTGPFGIPERRPYYVRFYVQAGGCVPRLRMGVAADSVSGHFIYPSLYVENYWLRPQGPNDVLLPPDYVEPAWYAAFSEIATGRLTASGDFYPVSPFDLYNPSIHYNAGGERFSAWLLSARYGASIHSIKDMATGESLPTSAADVPLGPPSKPGKRFNDLATTMAIRGPLTYIHVAHTPECPGPPPDEGEPPSPPVYNVQKNWIVDQSGNFLDAEYNILPLPPVGSGIDPPTAQLSAQQKEEVFRGEWMTDLMYPERTPTDACDAENINKLNLAQNSPKATEAFIAELAPSGDNPDELLAPDSRRGIHLNRAIKQTWGDGVYLIRDRDPAWDLAKEFCFVKLSKLKLEAAEDACNSTLLADQSETLEVPGLNIDAPSQADTPWPHDGWGFYWLLAGETRKRPRSEP